MTSDSKFLSFEEVSKHNRKTDCWLIIFEKVYDVTTFLDDHPGGYDALLLATGKDATEDFKYVGHSEEAIDKMKNYYIGEIDTNSLPQKTEYKWQSITTNQASSINILTFVLPILILALAYALY